MKKIIYIVSMTCLLPREFLKQFEHNYELIKYRNKTDSSTTQKGGDRSYPLSIITHMSIAIASILYSQLYIAGPVYMSMKQMPMKHVQIEHAQIEYVPKKHVPMSLLSDKPIFNESLSTCPAVYIREYNADSSSKFKIPNEVFEVLEFLFLNTALLKVLLNYVINRKGSRKEFNGAVNEVIDQMSSPIHGRIFKRPSPNKALVERLLSRGTLKNKSTEHSSVPKPKFSKISRDKLRYGHNHSKLMIEYQTKYPELKKTNFNLYAGGYKIKRRTYKKTFQT